MLQGPTKCSRFRASCFRRLNGTTQRFFYYQFIYYYILSAESRLGEYGLLPYFRNLGLCYPKNQFHHKKSNNTNFILIILENICFQQEFIIHIILVNYQITFIKDHGPRAIFFWICMQAYMHVVNLIYIFQNTYYFNPLYFSIFFFFSTF